MLKPESLSICLINLRSCNNKAAPLKQFINSLDLEICAVTETWQKEGDEDGQGWSKMRWIWNAFYTMPIKIGWRNCNHKQGKSTNCRVTWIPVWDLWMNRFQNQFDQCSYTLGLFYRPEDHPFLSFINDMVEYMENNITDKSEFLLLGDFNIHINKLHNDEAVTFHNFLSSFSLQNHVLFPTCKSQNILDLVITHESTDIMSNFLQGEMISDHFAVHFNLETFLQSPDMKGSSNSGRSKR